MLFYLMPQKKQKEHSPTKRTQDKNMKTNTYELAKRFGMKVHEEKGLFIERHYENKNEKRADSGSIYYFVDKDEKTDFHKIDCDEYWCYNAGSTLELWIIDLDGKLIIRKCGIAEDAEPTIYIPKGAIFASRHAKNCNDGTFITAITVPRFEYEGFELFSKEEMIKKYPIISRFWEEKL